MSETLTWTFRARDEISPASRRATQAVEGLEHAIRGLQRTIGSQGFGGAQQSIRGINRDTQQLHGTIGQVASGIGRVFTIAAAITGTAMAIGGAFGAVAARISSSVVEMIRFRESAVVTLGTLLRGRGQGREAISRVGGAAFRQTQAIARLTPGNERDVISARTQAAAAGFRGREEERVLAGSLDVGALNPNDSTAQSRFVRALGQIRGRGALQGEELNQLGELGIGRQEIFAAIARQRGMTGTETENTQRIQDLMRRGQIRGDEGTNAALSAVQSMTGERLGGFARLQGGTLGGSLSNLEESIFGLVTGINQLENLPGVRMFAQSITAIGNALNGSSESGKKLQASVAGIIDSAAGMFGGVFTPQRIEGFVGALAEFLPKMFEAFKLVGGAFVQGLGRALGPVIEAMGSMSGGDGNGMLAFAQMLGESLGFIVGVSIQVVAGIAAIAAGLTVLAANGIPFLVNLPRRFGDAMMWIAGLPMQFGTMIANSFSTMGTQLIDGLVSGITSGAGRVIGAVRGLASGAITSASKTLRIASPSRVFEELGGHTAAGYERGIVGGTRGARAAVDDMVSPPGAAGTGGPMTGRGVFQVFIDGAGREASSIVDEMEARMGITFDRLALSGGEV